MRIEVIITSVGYADFLAITLPQTRRWFESITVVTAPDDFETIAIAKRERASLHITDVWRRNEARFNKAAAINSLLDQRNLDETDCWVLFLDADILLPIDLNPDISKLDPRGLYSIKRRMCSTVLEWRELITNQRHVSEMPLYIPPVVKGKVWRHLPTANPAALSVLPALARDEVGWIKTTPCKFKCRGLRHLIRILLSRRIAFVHRREGSASPGAQKNKLGWPCIPQVESFSG